MELKFKCPVVEGIEEKTDVRGRIKVQLK